MADLHFSPHEDFICATYVRTSNLHRKYMPKIIPPKIRAAAVELLSRGVSHRDAAAQLTARFKREVSASAVRTWYRAAKAAEAIADEAPPSSVAPAPRAPEPESPPAAEAPPGDLLEDTRRMLRDAQALARQASADGNHAAAQRAQKNAADLAKLLARLESTAKAGGDGIVFTRAQLDAARQAMGDRVARLAADLERTGGLVCSECGRNLRIKIARGER